MFDASISRISKSRNSFTAIFVCECVIVISESWSLPMINTRACIISFQRLKDKFGSAHCNGRHSILSLLILHAGTVHYIVAIIFVRDGSF